MNRIILISLATAVAFAQAPAPAPPKPAAAKERVNARALPQNNKPVLVLAEPWQHVPADIEHPVTQEAITNPNLELKLYGGSIDSGKDPDRGMWIVWHEQPQFEPLHLWTGLCKTGCAAALRDKYNYLDLRGNAFIRWDVKTTGFHIARPIVKLADGTWLIGDKGDSASVDWHVSEISFGDVRWRNLDIKRVVEAADGKWVDHPDLSRVDEIGFADQMAGSGHGPAGWSDIGKIEVFGKASPRTASK